jgi:hypothetical protein
LSPYGLDPAAFQTEVRFQVSLGMEKEMPLLGVDH